MIPGLFYNFKRALIPLMHDETYDAMNRVQDLVEANSFATKVKNSLASRQLKDGSTASAATAATTNGGGGVDEDEDYGMPVIGDKKAVPVAESSVDSDKPPLTANEVVDSILSAPPTCEPGSRYCAPCYELA